MDFFRTHSTVVNSTQELKRCPALCDPAVVSPEHVARAVHRHVGEGDGPSHAPAAVGAACAWRIRNQALGECVISFCRKKTGTVALIRFGDEVAEILRSRPTSGPLFPYVRRVRAGDRATEFKQRCDGLGIKGVSLHSYRYSWAERAKKAGYPERFAQEALGHNSKAVHRAYARKAKVELPPLSEYERQREKFATLPKPVEPVAIAMG